MYYGKYLEDGNLVSLLTFDQPPHPTEGLVEITEEEYNEIFAEIMANIPEEPEVDPNVPTYDELAEAYTILTGGIASE